MFVPLLLTAVSFGFWPALEFVPESAAPRRDDTAVVIGIEDYAFVSDIPGARQNAADWARWLQAQGVPPGSIDLLTDQRATNHGIMSAVERRAAEVRPGGRFWLVYIGHGAPNQTGEDGVLVGVDAQQSVEGLYSRSIPRQELLRAVAQNKSKDALVVLDACFSGNTATGMVTEGLMPLIPVSLLQVPGPVVLSAGTSDQFAGALPAGDRPAFSYLLLGALQGWGDRDADGVVTAREAVDYTGEVLAVLDSLTGRAQTPLLDAKDPSLALGRGRAVGPDYTSLLTQSGLSVELGPGEAEYIATLERRLTEERAAAEKEAARRAAFISERREGALAALGAPTGSSAEARLDHLNRWIESWEETFDEHQIPTAEVSWFQEAVAGRGPLELEVIAARADSAILEIRGEDRPQTLEELDQEANAEWSRLDRRQQSDLSTVKAFVDRWSLKAQASGRRPEAFPIVFHARTILEGLRRKAQGVPELAAIQRELYDLRLKARPYDAHVRAPFVALSVMAAFGIAGAVGVEGIVRLADSEESNTPYVGVAAFGIVYASVIAVVVVFEFRALPKNLKSSGPIHDRIRQLKARRRALLQAGLRPEPLGQSVVLTGRF